MSSIDLSYTDFFIGKTVSLSLGADGNPLSPDDQRAQIKRPLELIKSEAWFFAHHRRQQALPPLGSVVTESSLCANGRVRLMLPCVAYACQRLATAPAGMCVIYMTTRRWAGWIMQRVTRGRIRKVQVMLQRRRVCCAVRCTVRLTRAAGNGS